MFSSVTTAIYLGLVVRFSVAVWNGFWGPSLGAEADAASFHRNAVKFASEFDINPFYSDDVFSTALGFIYYLTIDSLFLGSLLSCFVWFASAYFLSNLMKELSISRVCSVTIMYFYALLPSSILFTSVTLRETYQLFFVNLAVLSVMRIYLRRKNSYFIWLFISIAGMSLLHGALFAFGLFIIASTLLWLPLQKGEKMSLVKLIAVMPLVLLILYYGSSLFTSLSYNLDDGVVKSVETYQLGGISENARAQYRSNANFGGLIGFIAFLPISLMQYLFEPMPWRISSVADIPVFLENILRGWLLWRVWSGFKKTPGAENKPLLLVFLCYIVLEFIWSLGTLNWGTAARHHVPSIGLLLISAFAVFDKGINRSYGDNTSVTNTPSKYTPKFYWH